MPAAKRGKEPPRGTWPSTDDQLDAARATHGSQLERLIRDNQDPSLLRPEEREDDDIAIPLWLRVHYRRNHPEQPLSPAGPVGDYPEALENIHEWMKLHQDDIFPDEER
jgi:hypothetical protein